MIGFRAVYFSHAPCASRVAQLDTAVQTGRSVQSRWSACIVGSCSYEDDDMATRRDHVIHVSMLVLVALHRVTAGNDELKTGLSFL
jgi:hypothetical protein